MQNTAVLEGKHLSSRGQTPKCFLLNIYPSKIKRISILCQTNIRFSLCDYSKQNQRMKTTLLFII